MKETNVSQRKLVKKLCDLAEAYILEEHARPGTSGYLYEESLYEDEDSVVFEPFPRSDEEYVRCFKIHETKIISSVLTHGDEKNHEYTVHVKAEILLSNEKDEHTYEEREMDCYIGYEEEFFVTNVEE